MAAGPEGAAARAATWLEEDLPRQLAAQRAELGLDLYGLPDPALVAPQDRLRLGIEEWPAVCVEVQDLRRLVRVDVVEGVETYAATYAARTWINVRGEDEVDVDLVRKRYALAVRTSYLSRRQLRAATPFGEVAPSPSGILVDPISLRESYSPTAQDDTGATILGASVSLELVVREELRAPGALGPVVATQLDTRPVPTHPANG